MEICEEEGQVLIPFSLSVLDYYSYSVDHNYSNLFIMLVAVIAMKANIYIIIYLKNTY